MKAQAIVTSQGRIVSLDITVNYCHDMKLFKMSCRNIGQAGKILADSGYQGLMKIYPQAQTPRKSSKLFTGNGHLEDLSKISEPEKLYAYIAEATA
ncbi:transposase-like protein%2C IS1381 ISSpn7 [Streptococcus pneumoniae]|nr:transposase-like protein%2C IS1381 ISSpn7 [Streptococcus pneumoniae]